jgi:hypothetical protein
MLMGRDTSAATPIVEIAAGDLAYSSIGLGPAVEAAVDGSPVDSDRSVDGDVVIIASRVPETTIGVDNCSSSRRSGGGNSSGSVVSARRATYRHETTTIVGRSASHYSVGVVTA